MPTDDDNNQTFSSSPTVPSQQGGPAGESAGQAPGPVQNAGQAPGPTESSGQAPPGDGSFGSAPGPSHPRGGNDGGGWFARLLRLFRLG